MTSTGLCAKGLHPRTGKKPCTECKKARDRAYYEKRREHIKARSRKRYVDNKEAAAAYHRVRYAANREARKKAAREHRAKNLERYRAYDRERGVAQPERKKASNKKAYRDKPELFKARAKARREANPEAERERNKRWHAENKERSLELRVGWYTRNIEHARDLARKQAAKDRDKGRLNLQRRRARLRDSSSPGVTKAQWLAVCSAYVDREGLQLCSYCARRCARPTIDHVVPISRGGRDAPDNVRPACRRCNASKGKKLLSEWRGAPPIPEPTECQPERTYRSSSGTTTIPLQDAQGHIFLTGNPSR